MVSFSQLNLGSKGHFSPPGNTGAMDVIFCRNVLMYLSADMREKVILRLTGALSKGGWFIVSPSETSFVQAPGLNPVRFPGAILHRKESSTRADRKAAKVVLPRRTREQRKPWKSAIIPLPARAAVSVYQRKNSRPQAHPLSSNSPEEGKT